jgi:hypothetical protein
MLALARLNSPWNKEILGRVLNNFIRCLFFIFLSRSLFSLFEIGLTHLALINLRFPLHKRIKHLLHYILPCNFFIAQREFHFLIQIKSKIYSLLSLHSSCFKACIATCNCCYLLWEPNFSWRREWKPEISYSEKLFVLARQRFSKHFPFAAAYWLEQYSTSKTCLARSSSPPWWRCCRAPLHSRSLLARHYLSKIPSSSPQLYDGFLLRALTRSPSLVFTQVAFAQQIALSHLSLKCRGSLHKCYFCPWTDQTSYRPQALPKLRSESPSQQLV